MYPLVLTGENGHNKKHCMKILGLDPGFAAFGYALVAYGTTGMVVEALGVLRTEPSSAKRKVLASDDNARRAREIVRDLRPLVEGARLVCTESMSFPRSSSAAAKMALSWGLIVAEVDRCDRPLLQATPQEIKKRLCQNKSADKLEVENELNHRFGEMKLKALLKTVPRTLHNHAYDALAAIIACLDSEQGRMLKGMT